MATTLAEPATKIGRRHQKKESWTLEKIVLDFVDYLEEGGNIYSRIFSKRRKATILQLKNYRMNYDCLLSKTADFLSERGKDDIAEKCRNYKTQLKKPWAFQVKDYITVEKLLDAIQFYHIFGIPLTKQSIMKIAPHLYKETCRKIGWTEACERATGFRNREKWSHKKIIDELISVARNNEPLNSAELIRKHPKLYATIEARKYFPEGLLGAINTTQKYLQIHQDRLAERFDYDKIKKPCGRPRKHLTLNIPSAKIHCKQRKITEREEYVYFKELINCLETLLTQPAQKRTTIFSYNNGAVHQRKPTVEEQHAIDIFYDWDKKDDDKLLIIAQEKHELLCDTLAQMYKNQLIKALDMAEKFLSHLFCFVMQQYEGYGTAIHHPALDAIRLNPTIKNIYEHSIIIAQPDKDSFDTTKPLQRITVNPICLDTLLDLLTGDYDDTSDREETLYLQITRYFSCEIPKKINCYLRT
ncbi:hypothetical protein HY485_01260, partial [Candidatus Woesearchaeota archaeon]|nr:hypothetical protein [Candidatus Woesearchaeota archaeon]